MTITKSGLHYGVPAKAYHADPCPTPSLSSGIARKILSDSIAHAHSAHPKLGGASGEVTDSLGLGSLVHSLMDDGPEKDFELGPFEDYKTKEARAWRDGVSIRGKYPVLSRDLVAATPIASALKATAGANSDRNPFDPSAKCEVTGIWMEEGVYCRARYDRLVIGKGTADVWDWKTSSDVTDRGIIRSIAKYGYHIQAAFYLRGLEKCLPDPAVLSFTFVFVEATAPYTVRRVRLSDTFLAEGRRKVDEAIQKWQFAMRFHEWHDPRQFETFEAEMPIWMEDDVEIEFS